MQKKKQHTMSGAGLVKTHFLKNDDLSSLLVPDAEAALTATKGVQGRAQAFGGRKKRALPWPRIGGGRAAPA